MRGGKTGKIGLTWRLDSVSTKGLRHLTATELFHAGHPVSLIQHILRRKNPNTTARYPHSLGLDNALERIDGTF